MDDFNKSVLYNGCLLNYSKKRIWCCLKIYYNICVLRQPHKYYAGWLNEYFSRINEHNQQYI